MKIKRQEKIKYLSDLYGVKMMTDSIVKDAPVLNQIIIDSLGISGLKIVKKNAWKFAKSLSKTQNPNDSASTEVVELPLSDSSADSSKVCLRCEGKDRSSKCTCEEECDHMECAMKF